MVRPASESARPLITSGGFFLEPAFSRLLRTFSPTLHGRAEALTIDVPSWIHGRRAGSGDRGDESSPSCERRRDEAGDSAIQTLMRPERGQIDAHP